MNIRKYTIAFCAVILLTITFTTKAYSDTAITRYSGADRYKTAVEISKAGFKAAQNIILASGQDFPDALCASPLAVQLHSPILLTEKDNLNGDTENELKRLGARKIFIIGGTGVISEAIERKLDGMGLQCTRLWGADRYATSLSVADYIYSNFKTGKNIAAAAGDDFPDALSISPIAANLCIPILLVPSGSISVDTKVLLNKKSIKKTYVLGDSSIISDVTMEQLPSPERITGKSKYERNINILEYFKKDIDMSTVYFSTGEDYPDALAGSVIAASTESPIILIDPNLSALPQPVDIYLNNLRISKEDPSVAVLGGYSAVPDKISSSIDTALHGVKTKVLVIDIDPAIESKNNKKIHEIGNWNDPHKLAQQCIDDMKEVSKDYINYEIVNWIDLDEFGMGKDGFQYDKETYVNTLEEAKAARWDYWAYDKWRKSDGFMFDYDYYIQRFNIAKLVEDGKVDEVWFFQPPCDGNGVYESLMVGRDAYWCNSTPIIREDCRKFVVMGFNFERGVDCMLEDFGHRFESVMSHIYGWADYGKPLDNMNNWERFTLYDKVSPGNAGCGTIHYAPNSQSDYDWGSRTKVWTNYVDWLEYPNLTGRKVLADCSAWGNGNMRLHHKWWFSCIPHTGGTGDDGVLNNWWYYFNYSI